MNSLIVLYKNLNRLFLLRKKEYQVLRGFLYRLCTCVRVCVYVFEKIGYRKVEWTRGMM